MSIAFYFLNRVNFPFFDKITDLSGIRRKIIKNEKFTIMLFTKSRFDCMYLAGVDRRPKLRPKAEAFFPPASASVAEAFGQKLWQKV